MTRNTYNDRISRLEALAAVAAPAKIAEQARPPDTPFSPKPVRAGLIAGFLGLLMGTALAFVRNTLDRRLKGSEEIQQRLGLPLLGHVRAEAMGKAGQAEASRAPLSDLDFEGFRIVRANLDFLVSSPKLKVVLVTSCLPQEGKSTVAASLAFTTAMAGQRTLLLECDLRRPSLAPRLGLEKIPGLVEYLLGEVEPADILHTLSPVGLANGSVPDTRADGAGAELVCALAGRSTDRPAELLGTERFHQALVAMRSDYDIVIVDSAPLLPVVDTLALLPLVDSVIVCVRDLRTTIEQAVAGRDILKNVPDCPAGLVVTGLASDRGADYGYYGQAYSYDSR